MKNKWIAGMLMITLCLAVGVPLAPAAETEEEAVVSNKPIDQAADKVGQTTVFLLGIPMFLGSIPAWLWDQVGNALDGWSDDTAEKDVPVARGTDTIPDDVKEQIPHDDVAIGA